MVKTYKVGGFIRDRLLNIKSDDTDYVVVGATLEYMQQMGFVPVGRDFPVFIDPKTGNQYALARTERKSGTGYHGFQFYTTPDVTLEDDLKRRDITINAIAEDEDGNLIDPFNGIDDIHNKIIRHVSDAFVEDPLRVLRVARFSAKLGFTIATNTLKLIEQICKSGELQFISKERIWEEVKKAIATQKPLQFFKVLNQVGALVHILSEFSSIIENNSLFNELEDELDKAIKLGYNSPQKFGIIMAKLSVINPELALGVLSKAKLGQDYIKPAYIIVKHSETIFKLSILNNDEVLQLIKNLDLIRNPKRLEYLSSVLSISSYNKPLLEHNLFFLAQICDCLRSINYAELDQSNKAVFIQQVRQKKLEIINKLSKQFYGI